MVDSPGEERMKSILDTLVEGFVALDNHRPPWMTNFRTTTSRLEFDRFYPELGIGFEYQGAQHRKGNGWTSSEQRQRDRIKREVCNARGVVLVEVHSSEQLDSKNLRRKLRRALNACASYYGRSKQWKSYYKGLARRIGQGESIKPPSTDLTLKPIEFTIKRSKPHNPNIRKDSGNSSDHPGATTVARPIGTVG